MKKIAGFTLIELLVFIVVIALFSTVSIYALKMTLVNAPTAEKSLIALETAQQCIEYYSGQRNQNGFASVTCPSTSVPSYCTAPSGYALSVNIACTTINGDTNYKTITVTVSGTGSATLTLLIAG